MARWHSGQISGFESPGDGFPPFQLHRAPRRQLYGQQQFGAGDLLLIALSVPSVGLARGSIGNCANVHRQSPEACLHFGVRHAFMPARWMILRAIHD